MSRPYVSVRRIERRLSTGGNREELRFLPGVNLIVGRPNTGKTKWLQTLDFLLGDPGGNPFEGSEEGGLAEKYDAAMVELLIGEETVTIERRWRESGARTRLFVNGEGMTGPASQEFLMQKLGIPLLHFPRGNPMSGQTWPELSFRMLLRHIHRQQRFWGDIADLQPEGEQHACLLQFLGLAEKLFTQQYGDLVRLKMEVERLKARREQYGQTLDELARDILSEDGSSVGASSASVAEAEGRLARDVEALLRRRTEVIARARDKALSRGRRGVVERLGEERAGVLGQLEDLRRKSKATAERLDDVKRYRSELQDESERMNRAEDSAAILADLKITHCPACDQPVDSASQQGSTCFLCHQALPAGPLVEELGATRLRFERERLLSEAKEADDLLAVLQTEARRLSEGIIRAQDHLGRLESELAPSRAAVAPLVQEDVSTIDRGLGELSARQSQLRRVGSALEIGQKMTELIAALEAEIEPLQVSVDESARGTDFDAAARQLQDGMNSYLNAINRLRRNVWRHNEVAVDLSRSSYTMRVGARRWRTALGGTDSLYFLMAYHYGLLTLSDKARCHYPGLSIIDVPAEFSGEAVEDKENFIVQPFIDLLSRPEYEGAQAIITGVSFTGLEGAHRLRLTRVHVA